MISFSSLETRVQHYADDKSLALSDSRFIGSVNAQWRKFVASRWWAEHTLKDTSLTTVVGQEEYTWPISVGFYEEPFVALLDASDSDRPYRLVPAASEEDWEAEFSTSTGWPTVYRRYSVAGVLKLALRINPDTTGDKILIRGRVEPRRFVGTNYANVNADSTSGTAILKVSSVSMFAAGDWVRINESGPRDEQGVILSLQSTTPSITLTTNLTYSHTAAQVDKVERMTSFMLNQDDEILALMIASDVKAKRGYSQRAAELLAAAQGLLPRSDTNPKAQSLNIEPTGI